ncbi:hypothetical protein AMK16_10570 [Streptomyces sp. CB00455]|uniref:hypothetical protein n=1 Tax=Streptomyces sp. CB00455 TaxID=1703927 RepID=UPI00093FBB70|nr:hypothetical protein [Streptomyces sp. CB00455]OKK20850.1 hypothetical protein AMK16_10570 [Streptomyces sp. CB00455]
MSARRPLLTALGASTLLAALWFVPSANATAPGLGVGDAAVPAAADSGRTATLTSLHTQARPGVLSEAEAEVEAETDARPAPLTLANTGSVDTTPYLMGGALCLGVGAGCVAFSVRRSRAL